MKKLLVFLVSLLFFMPVVNAQVYDQDTGAIILSPESGVTLNRDEGYPRGFSIAVGGYEIAFAGNDTPTENLVGGHKKKHKKYYKGKLAVVDFGFNDFTSVSYKNYDASQRGFLDLRNGKSIYLAVNPFRTSAAITRDGTLGFTTGIGLVWRNYTFDNPLTLVKENGRIVPMELESDRLKKSKLTTVAIDIPVMLDVNFGKFFISGGVYGGLVIGSHTKFKQPKTKSKGGTAVEMFEYGITARAGFRHLYVFGNYGFNDIFKSGKGPSARTYTVGFGLPF